jgi:hypothetical protein
MSSSADKAKRLAVLAAREDTPEHERIAAALQLAKIVARDGVPEHSDGDRFASTHGSGELTHLRRKVAALETIVEQNAAELRELRAEKADLEARLGRQRAAHRAG